MKKHRFNIKVILTLLIAGMFVIIACEKEEVFPRTRLFQPVLNEDLYSVDNTIVVNLGNMKEAQNYTIEVSRDSFLTTEYTFQIDTTFVIINNETIGEDLLWFTIYQVQATAHADDSEYDSKPSLLGSIRTQKFPSNMGTPTPFDVLDTRARVFWSPAGAPITGVKIFAGDDERLMSPLAEYELTNDEMDASEKIVSGLNASSIYQIAIYSGNTLRGWEVYTTREAFVSGDNVLDLSGIDSTVVLADTLPSVANGTIVVLEGGKIYMAGGYAFDKSISFVSGYSFVQALPVIDMSTNFNIADGATVDYVTFKDIHLTAPDGFDSRYVFNIDVSGTIGEIKFESCKIRTLRGVARMKGGTGSLDKYTIYDCEVDSIRDYAILTVDKTTWICNDIHFENSTFTRCRMFLTSRNNSNSIVIESCTIGEAPEQGRQMFRWRQGDQEDVLNGIKISNTIWGRGWYEGLDVPVHGVDGFDGMANTNWIITNSYSTSDFSFAEGKDEIPGFPIGNYSGTVNDLWEDPENGNFNFKDTGFAGKGDSGDPRWRIGL
ncbi:MAG: DUF5123 domain-containing protein [Mariniphaga sp.]|nr:DUF5123 domain-containing protein [Mariniphaga sp.]